MYQLIVIKVLLLYFLSTSVSPWDRKHSLFRILTQVFWKPIRCSQTFGICRQMIHKSLGTNWNKEVLSCSLTPGSRKLIMPANVEGKKSCHGKLQASRAKLTKVRSNYVSHMITYVESKFYVVARIGIDPWVNWCA